NAQMSNILNPERWDSVSPAMWRRVSARLGVKKEHVEGEWRLVTTDNYNIVHEVCRDAQENSRMLGLIGDTGYGKTEALELYAKKTPKVGYVLCDVLQNQKDWLIDVAKSFGLDESGTKRTILGRICSWMSKQEDAVLILDDLGKVDDNIYRLIQLIYDRTKGRAGIVLAGMPNLKAYIMYAVRRDKKGFRELKRRIEYWEVLDEPTPADKQSLCELNGIEDKRCIKAIQRGVKDLGTLKNVVINSLRIAGEDPVTLDIVEDQLIKNAA
ncbi:MAG: AAA family ATPase, partial [Bacteroidota bacterium]